MIYTWFYKSYFKTKDNKVYNMNFEAVKTKVVE